VKNLVLIFAVLICVSCNQNDSAEAKTSDKKVHNVQKPQPYKPSAQNRKVNRNVEPPIAGTGQGIKWVKINNVEDAMKKSKKPIIMDVYTSWCGPCKMLDKNTFTNPEIISIFNNNFHPVKFNAEGPEDVTFGGKEYSNPGYKPERARTRNGKHQFTSTLAVRGYPSIVIMDENYKIIEKIAGYRTPAQLKQALTKYL